ncbi:hypothetical protein SY212_03410 [Ligilactobacillus agilis]|uniref:Uncharacterized protein n=1 Tax=Ligilactobacillus agilis TaxID=1601 RepID=A0A6F9XJ71_9LACO|nr:hypothetical protein [Ligilactobacillus agilis]GET05311.1 hypothetical protein SY212_03410 [Ligilactobacillus agilis]
MYNYELDVNNNIVEDTSPIVGSWVHLSKTEVNFLVKMLKIERLNTPLHYLDYLRGAVEAIDGIDLPTYYSLVRVIVDRHFKTDFKIKEPRYYVHIVPTPVDYLNMRDDGTFSITTPTERAGFKTKFTMAEIEEMKHDSRFKGINFDECLEEVKDGD